MANSKSYKLPPIKNVSHESDTDNEYSPIRSPVLEFKRLVRGIEEVKRPRSFNFFTNVSNLLVDNQCFENQGVKPMRTILSEDKYSTTRIGCFKKSKSDVSKSGISRSNVSKLPKVGTSIFENKNSPTNFDDGIDEYDKYKKWQNFGSNLKAINDITDEKLHKIAEERATYEEQIRTRQICPYSVKKINWDITGKDEYDYDNSYYYGYDAGIRDWFYLKSLQKLTLNDKLVVPKLYNFSSCYRRSTNLTTKRFDDTLLNCGIQRFIAIAESNNLKDYIDDANYEKIGLVLKASELIKIFQIVYAINECNIGLGDLSLDKFLINYLENDIVLNDFRLAGEIFNSSIDSSSVFQIWNFELGWIKNFYYKSLVLNQRREGERENKNAENISIASGTGFNYINIFILAKWFDLFTNTWIIDDVTIENKSFSIFKKKNSLKRFGGFNLGPHISKWFRQFDMQDKFDQQTIINNIKRSIAKIPIQMNEVVKSFRHNYSINDIKIDARRLFYLDLDSLGIDPSFGISSKFLPNNTINLRV
jgi:hypothetical protein